MYLSYYVCIILIIIIKDCCESNAYCGKPGKRISSKFETVKVKKRFDSMSDLNDLFLNGTIIRYYCSNDSQLIDPEIRYCVNGTWTGSIPRCGKISYNDSLI